MYKDMHIMQIAMRAKIFIWTCLKWSVKPGVEKINKDPGPVYRLPPPLHACYYDYTYGSTYSRNGSYVPYYMQYKMFTFIKLQLKVLNAAASRGRWRSWATERAPSEVAAITLAYRIK